MKRPATPVVAPKTSSRRRFIGTVGSALGAATLSQWSTRSLAGAEPFAPALPRWRGFNLTNFFQAFSRGEEGQGQIREDDLRWIRDWGFDFVRLPMDYWLWIDTDWKTTRKLAPDDLLKIKEATLEKVDRTVELCRGYGLHLSLNFHRAPGYCINNPEREPLLLWRDALAEEAFVHHWELFARRYRSIPRAALSLNLLNEAPNPREGYMSRADYARVMGRATDAIRRHSPDRIVIVDGLSVGNDIVTELIPSGVAQSVHAYWPAGISHYRADWVDRDQSFPLPTWPLRNRDGTIQADRGKLEERFAPWGALVQQGIGVHCGECGCYNKTPYDVFRAWFGDVLDILKSHQIGYALWNFRGSFGILDSGRADIPYEDWDGHKLDRQLLALLQAH
jgi:aryl-phospho-beta-D-glucosidase BglC (GH1 family)